MDLASLADTFVRVRVRTGEQARMDVEGGYVASYVYDNCVESVLEKGTMFKMLIQASVRD